MRAAIFFVVGIAALLQVTAAQQMQAYGISFNFVLAAIVVYGFFGGDYRRAAYAACAAGLFLDTYSGAPFGTITAGLLAAVVASAMLARVSPREHFLHFLLYAAVGTLSFYGIVLITMKVVNFSFIIPWVGASEVGAYTILGMALIYGIYQWSILLKNRRGGR